MRDKAVGIQPRPAFWIYVHHTRASHFQERLLRRPKAHSPNRDRPLKFGEGGIGLQFPGRSRKRHIPRRHGKVTPSPAARKSRRTSCEETGGSKVERSSDIFLALGYARTGAYPISLVRRFDNWASYLLHLHQTAGRMCMI